MTEFALLARVPEPALDLERLAVGVARMRTPSLAAEDVQKSLDNLATVVADAVDPGAPPDKLARQLQKALGGTLGFNGIPGKTWKEEGSCIDAVLENREGLPILLSVVWILLGERLGVPIVGINRPGHFIVALDAPSARMYLDPFAGGAIHDGAELLAQAERHERSLLAPVGPKPIVVRMLNNLKHLYVEEEQWAKALGVVERIQLLLGETPNELRDRGMLCLRLGRNDEAIRDLERYLVVAEGAPDRGPVEKLLRRVKGTG